MIAVSTPPASSRRLTEVALLGLLLAGCTPAAGASIEAELTPVPPTATPLTTESQAAPTAAPPTAVAPCFSREALRAMALAEIAALPTVCFEDESGSTIIDQADAIEVIRAFIEDPTRLVGFREMSLMGNSPSGRLPVGSFEDERGASYLMAMVAGKVLEMNSDPGPLQPGGDVLPDEQLQSIAEDLIRRELPTFDDLQDRLTFEAGAKDGGVNFFRWEHASGPGLSGMPPLAQVGITDDGRIFSYLNTLYVLQ